MMSQFLFVHFAMNLLATDGFESEIRAGFRAILRGVAGAAMDRARVIRLSGERLFCSYGR